ncbi:MAG TPA: FAD-binding oxidoreductase [Aestuariivirgaceae bacterium]|jgi:gamma-glutamylputrescine oxidase|nr:FAD-binding oxidoreductase [Aestuariivirgaceae bacterium]
MDYGRPSPLDGQSYYRATATPYPALSPLAGEARADVAVIGAGLTGLSAALELTARGYSVVVVERGRLGDGGSGRNGGQICTGFAPGMSKLERVLGRRDAEICFAVAEEGKALIRQHIAAHKIGCDLAEGQIVCAPKPGHLDALARERDELESYGYHQTSLLDAAELHARVGTPLYHGGLLDRGGGHFHPLNYVIGLGRALLQAGGRIHEHSPVLSIEPGSRCVLRTAQGVLSADAVVVACNAYVGRLLPAIAPRIMPVASYVIATAPLAEALASSLIRDGEAVADANFVVDYFRLTRDRRMLFGGRCSYSGIDPSDLAANMRPRLARVFPQLSQVAIDYAWGGHIAITYNRLPDAGRIGKSLYYAQGYSGQGVVLSGIFGKMMAEAIAGETSRFDIFGRIPHAPFPGGPLARPALTLGMLYYRIRDLLA